jgi:RNA 2',3'-cyclic 3'-phosphodiesterase
VIAAERLRLFVAADLPGEQLASIESATRELRAALPQARWTAPWNQHLTLKFLGATEAERLPEVARVCVAVAAGEHPAEVQLSGVGAFPSVKRARVIWIGVKDHDGLLSRVAGALDHAFEPLGYKTEARAYTPHLTLARFRSPEPVAGVLDRFALPATAPVAIDHLSLYRSRLSPKGAVYERLEEFALP